MTTENETRSDQLLRLLQLASPTLPVGAFSYSQGLEWAIESRWIADEKQFFDWTKAQLKENVAQVDVPILYRLTRAIRNNQPDEFEHWVRRLVSYRETRELREEEAARGAAMWRLLDGLELTPEAPYQCISQSQLAGIAWLGALWNIPIKSLGCAHAYSVVDNLISAGIKLVPLGQTQGQRLLLGLSSLIPTLVDRALKVVDQDIGASSMALAIASSRHETQYTRLFRS